eukprot:9467255-Pyramimonas_sp.AAC.2
MGLEAEGQPFRSWNLGQRAWGTWRNCSKATVSGLRLKAHGSGLEALKPRQDWGVKPKAQGPGLKAESSGPADDGIGRWAQGRRHAAWGRGLRAERIGRRVETAGLKVQRPAFKAQGVAPRAVAHRDPNLDRKASGSRLQPEGDGRWAQGPWLGVFRDLV